MKFKEINKVHSGKFIHRYDITYETSSGHEKVYEMISRNPDIDSREKLIGGRADAVVLILTDADGDKLLLNREFRLATGQWVYNFPAGLIDGDETPEEAAKRELFEETGLSLDVIDDVVGNSYSAIGFANESNICVIGKASGEIRPSDSEVEEIEAGWFTKDEVRELLVNNYFAARTQAYCYLWCRM
ncbi:MAG: NUDIX hydrolase [Eubacterium sp.]|nr:NUDIX hydrolase [Eubacterium sp.]